jgi:hypothetical protein
MIIGIFPRNMYMQRIAIHKNSRNSQEMHGCPEFAHSFWRIPTAEYTFSFLEFCDLFSIFFIFSIISLSKRPSSEKYR